MENSAEPFRFDQVIDVDIDGEERDLVVHRSPSDGVAIFYHSPLGKSGKVRCEICEGGARVYLA